MIYQIFFSTAKAVTDDLPLDDSVRLNDIVITLLMPQITSAVESFYAPYLTIKPTVVPYYGSKIIQIQGGESIHEDINNSHYTVTVEVLPYVGAHLSVGKDRITLNIQSDNVTIKNYEHINSYPIPPHYQSIIKKSLP